MLYQSERVVLVCTAEEIEAGNGFTVTCVPAAILFEVI